MNDCFGESIADDTGPKPMLRGVSKILGFGVI